MTVLIVGATGLIGKSLVKSCLSRGWRVHFLTTRKGQLNQIDGAYGFLWNIDQSFIDKACFEGVSVVVNLAGTPVSLPWRKANKRKILNSRILGARLLNDTLAALKGHHDALLGLPKYRLIGEHREYGYSGFCVCWLYARAKKQECPPNSPQPKHLQNRLYR
jgi:hypothetical protein